MPMSHYHVSNLSHSLSPNDPDQEVAFANAAIAQIDGEILDLQRKRVSWLRSLNQLQAATRVFPPEILSTIFEAAYKSTSRYSYTHDFLGSPPPHTLQVLKLGAVCSQWRDVAWSTPRLWIDITTPKSITLPYIDLLNLQYKNAGGHPVHVRFTNFYSSDSLGREMISIVFQREAAKLGSLTMPQNEHSSWPSIVSDFNTISFSRLRSLQLAYHRRIQPNFDFVFPYCPELHELHLDGETDWLAFKFPWSQITVLRLSVMTSSLSLKLILQCRRLVELHCSSIHHDSVTAPASQDAIDMTLLETLNWQGAIPCAFLTHVRCPALHQLNWDVRPSPPRESYMQFFASARHLAILNIRCDSPDIKEILYVIPSIQTIHILSSSNSKYVVEFLHSLTIASNGTHHLPLLKVLSISDLGTSDWQMAAAVTQMLESRWKLNCLGSRIGCGLEYFSLDYADFRERMNWTSAQKTTLKRLAVEGCGEMMIARQGVKVPWL